MTNSVCRVAVGSDHGGFERKEHIVAWLKARGYQVCDFGCHDAETGYDYPDIAFPVAESVADGRFDRAILVCTTGIGMCIAANKVRGIRCAACSEPYSARMTRMHNDANMLALGARVIGPEMARMIARIFLETPFEGGRHQRRVDMVMAIEDGVYPE